MEDRYAVRRSFDDLKSQMGLYHVLENAIRQASDFGLRVYDLETKKLVFEPTESRKEQLIANLKEMDKIMRQDIKNGHQWAYSNKSKRKANNFDEARKQGKYLTNCCDGVHWGLKKMGITTCSWFGAQGGSICWCGTNAEAKTRKYFDIIQTNCKKTVRQLVNDGTIQAGDVLTYVTMSHTNAYLGNNKSFDSGHAYCTRSGENAPFTKWVGNLSCAGQKVGCIMRLKEKKPEYYRVQVGSYSKQETIDKVKKLLKDAGFDTFEEKVGGNVRVFCGSFKQIPKAVERLEQVQAIDETFEKAYLRGV